MNPQAPISVLRERRLLLGVSGSIAAYKAVDLASRLTQAGARVDVLLTQAATSFVSSLTFQSVTGRRAYADRGGHRTVTWGELHDQARRFAAGLVALGLVAGDRVALCGENSIDWLTALHGILLAGGVADADAGHIRYRRGLPAWQDA